MAFKPAARAPLERFAGLGYDRLPVCIAKTQYSFSTDPGLLGAPTDHTVSVRDVVLANGAEFAVVLCGDIMTMPGLPRRPAAEGIRLDARGEIEYYSFGYLQDFRVAEAGLERVLNSYIDQRIAERLDGAAAKSALSRPLDAV